MYVRNLQKGEAAIGEDDGVRYRVTETSMYQAQALERRPAHS